MALGILRAVNGKIVSKGQTNNNVHSGIGSAIHAFKPENILQQWLKWLDSKPKATGYHLYENLTIRKNHTCCAQLCQN